MAKRKTKKKVVQAPKVAPDAPVDSTPTIADAVRKTPEGGDYANWLGRSARLDKCLEIATVITGNLMLERLKKYVDTNGSVVHSFQRAGFDKDGDPQTPASEAMRADLEEFSLLFHHISNLQRIRSDDSIDITKFPL